MKWETLQEPESEYKGKISVGEVATVEALRAIAERLDGIKHVLVIMAKLAVERSDPEEDEINQETKTKCPICSEYERWHRLL